MFFVHLKGKHIINEQFLLNRIAGASIDIYAMACVLSRCSQSLKEGNQSAMHEEIMAKVLFVNIKIICIIYSIFCLLFIGILQ